MPTQYILTIINWTHGIVRPNNVAALFVICIIIGVCSLPMLPVGMELSCELTRNTDGSAALVWFAWVSPFCSLRQWGNWICIGVTCFHAYSFWVRFGFKWSCLSSYQPPVLGALRAGPNGSPPLNMKHSLIFMGVVVVSFSLLIFLVHGEQRRKAMDEQKLKESLASHMQNRESGSSAASWDGYLLELSNMLWYT